MYILHVYKYYFPVSVPESLILYVPLHRKQDY